VGCILSPPFDRLRAGFRGWASGYIGEQVAGGEEGFAEVASDNLFRVADGGEIDARIPAEEYIDVRRYMLTKGDVSRRSLVVGISQERLEQFGDAGAVHVEGSIVDVCEKMYQRFRGGNPGLSWGWLAAGMRCFDCAGSSFGRSHFAQHDRD